MDQNAKGSGFLKVCGILMIIGGVIGIIASIVGFIGVTALAVIAGDEMNFGIYFVAVIMALIGSVIQLVTGIIGVINANKPEKAMTCIILGAVVAAVAVLSNIMFVLSGAQFNITSLITGLILPILFIVGGVKNKQG